MYCQYCGRKLPDGAAFCGYCGKPATVSAAAPAAPAKKKKSGVRTAVLALAIVLAMGACGFCAWRFGWPYLQVLQVEKQLEDGNMPAAVGMVRQMDDGPKARELYREALYQMGAIKTISAGKGHCVGLCEDGTVAASGDNEYGQCDVSDWTGIVDVAAGNCHTVGLRADGTVAAAGSNEYGQCDLRDWTDIVAVSAGSLHTVGLRADGTVAATGSNEYGQCDVADWTDIVSVSADAHTVGLRSDGTVAATGWDEFGQCNVSDWTDIVAVSAGGQHTVGLRVDGTVVAVGSNEYGQCDVNGWTNIVAVSAGSLHTVGLRADGTVVTAGDVSYGLWHAEEWQDIQAVSAGNFLTLGLRADGTALARGADWDGQTNAWQWPAVSVPYERRHVVKRAPLLYFADADEAPEQTRVPEQNGTYVQDAFSYTEEHNFEDAGHVEVDYHVPEAVINGVPAESLNSMLWQELYEDRVATGGTLDLANASYADNTMPELYTMNYRWAVEGEVLSILVAEYYGVTSYYDYSVYNISLTTGQLLTTDQFLPHTGLTDEAYRARLEETAYSCYTRYFSFGGSEGAEYTMAEENLSRAEPYFEENGDLCVTLPVATMVGAEYYTFLLDLDTNEIFGEAAAAYGVLEE